MKKLQNVTASKMQLILNESKRLQIPYEMLLRRYAFDRFLKRMVAAQEDGKLVLKGAMALYAYSREFVRPSKDIDFLGNNITADNVLPLVSAIASTNLEEDDGIVFDVSSFIEEPIAVKDEEAGTRVTGIARMGNTRIPLKIEVSFGHLITPEAKYISVPSTIPGDPEVQVLAYTIETILAEKFETVCGRGFTNTRIKDFFDIRALQRTQTLEGEAVVAAFKATFGHRKTELPEISPPAFRPNFIDEFGTRAWSAFIKKSGIRDKSDFYACVAEIEPFCMGFASMARGNTEIADWNPEEGFVDPRTVLAMK